MAASNLSRHDRTIRVWKHNALLGAAGMIEACCKRIMQSDTTTRAARGLARDILYLCKPLKAELKTRVD